ncbi:MAG: ABC transporter substrate-binding protein, partial [Candidatus Binatia bacterium]
MHRYHTALDRRQFLRQSSALGLATLFAPVLAPRAWAASRDRIVIYQGVSLDSLHPYGYSGGGITGIWRHVIEPLIQMDYDRNEYVGVLAQSWEFQGRKWIFHLRKGVRFHNGAPFTSKDVAFSIASCKTTSAACRAPTCKASRWKRPTITRLLLRPRLPMRCCSPGWKLGLFSRRSTATISTTPRP